MKRRTPSILLIILIVISSSTYVIAGRERPGVRYENTNVLVTITDRTGYRHRIRNPNFVIRGRAGSANVELPVRSFRRIEFYRMNTNNARVWYWDENVETITVNYDQHLRIGNRTIMLMDCESIEVIPR